jgi:hypothetical protein
MISSPSSGRVPVHAPDATHSVALLDVQIARVVPCGSTRFGSNHSDTLGVVSACTTTVAVTVPPAPVQASTYVALAFKTAVWTEPLTSRAPVQAPDAVQVVAFATVHTSVVVPP